MTYSESTIRSSLVSILEDVEDIGVVYDYERWMTDWNVLLSLFKTEIENKDQLRGWIVTAGGPPFWKEEIISFQGGGTGETILVTYNYRIRGFMSVDDDAGTEKIMTGLMMNVADAIKSSDDLQAYHFNDGVPIIVSGILEYRTLCNVLVHYAELNLQFQEIV